MFIQDYLETISLNEIFNNLFCKVHFYKQVDLKYFNKSLKPKTFINCRFYRFKYEN